MIREWEDFFCPTTARSNQFRPVQVCLVEVSMFRLFHDIEPHRNHVTLRRKIWYVIRGTSWQDFCWFHGPQCVAGECSADSNPLGFCLFGQANSILKFVAWEDQNCMLCLICQLKSSWTVGKARRFWWLVVSFMFVYTRPSKLEEDPGFLHVLGWLTQPVSGSLKTPVSPLRKIEKKLLWTIIWQWPVHSIFWGRFVQLVVFQYEPWKRKMNKTAWFQSFFWVNPEASSAPSWDSRWCCRLAMAILGGPKSHGATPLSLEGLEWKIPLFKWMIGGSPILGNLHTADI